MLVIIQVLNEIRNLDTEVLPFSFNYGQTKLTIQKCENGILHILANGKLVRTIPINVPFTEKNELTDILCRASVTASLPAILNSLNAAAFSSLQAIEGFNQKLKELAEPVEETKTEETKS